MNLIRDQSTTLAMCFRLHLFVFVFICISETYLHSSTPSDDINLEISGYTLIRADHAFNLYVCIYYKSFLLLRVLNA